MKLLHEELRARHEERKHDKSTLWTTWLIRIILLSFIVMFIRHFSDIHNRFFKAGSSNGKSHTQTEVLQP